MDRVQVAEHVSELRIHPLFEAADGLLDDALHVGQQHLAVEPGQEGKDVIRHSPYPTSRPGRSGPTVFTTIKTEGVLLPADLLEAWGKARWAGSGLESSSYRSVPAFSRSKYAP